MLVYDPVTQFSFFGLYSVLILIEYYILEAGSASIYR